LLPFVHFERELITGWAVFFAQGEGGTVLCQNKWSEPGFFGSGYTFTDFYNNFFLRLSAGFLSGEHIQQFQNVAGNWDGFFSQVLGSNQMLNTVGVEIAPSQVRKNSLQTIPFGLYGFMVPYSIDSTPAEIDMDQKTRYGFLDYFEAEEEFHPILQSQTTPTFDASLQLAFNNVPLRNYGPEKATNQEYFHGLSLRQSEIFGFVRYRVPFFKKDVDYQFIPVYQRATILNGIRNIGDFRAQDISSEIPQVAFSPNTTMLFDPDGAVGFSWGITNWLTFSNELEVAITNYKNPVPGTTVTPTNLSTYSASKNTTMAGVTSISFNLGSSHRLSFEAFFANQKEDGIVVNPQFINEAPTKDDLQNEMVMVLYQSAIPQDLLHSKFLNKIRSSR
jgi:hypothetical protein